MTDTNQQVLAAILPQLYGDLRNLAHHLLGPERRGMTLRTIDLVHESYLKLAKETDGQWKGRSHVLGVAALAMRRVLVDHARKRLSLRRGEGHSPLPLDEGDDWSESLASDHDLEQILAIDRLLGSLREVDERAAQVVECRFFAGYTVEETAETLEVSAPTVKRSWRFARAWLRSRLTDNPLD